MEKVPKGVYTKEFKEEAVKLVMETALGVPEVSRRLSVSKSTVEYWVRQAKKGSLSDNLGKRPFSAEDMEFARLRKENAELKMEREILKNRPKGPSPFPVRQETHSVYSHAGGEAECFLVLPAR
jgi:transposase-like protein